MNRLLAVFLLGLIVGAYGVVLVFDRSSARDTGSAFFAVILVGVIGLELAQWRAWRR